MAFGDRLKAWRLDHGMTQLDFVKELNTITGDRLFSLEAVSRWEHGACYPSNRVVFALPAVTHLSLDYIFQDEIKKFDPNFKVHKGYTDVTSYQDIFDRNEQLWKEQHKGCKYKYRKGNFICELTAI